MENRRLSAIQVFRGIAVLGVVAFHCATILKQYSINFFEPPKFLRFGQSGVDLFFVISGFVMVTVTRGHFGSGMEMSRFLYRRVTRIYPAYWFYSLLMLALVSLVPVWVNAKPTTHYNLWASFLLLPHKYYPVVLVAWSLIHEMWFYVVFSTLLLLRENKLVPMLVTWGLILVGLNLALGVDTFSPGLRLICHSHGLEFIGGALMAILVRSPRVQRVPTGVLLVILATAFVGLGVAYYLRAMRHTYLIRASTFAVLYATVLGSCVLLELRRTFVKMRFLNFVGNISYSMYLCHIMVLSLTAYVIKTHWSGPRGKTGALIVWTCMLGTTLLLSWIGYRFIERPALELSHTVGDRLLTAPSNVAAAKA
jgi:exopolysaccharide production protein ExoZ